MADIDERCDRAADEYVGKIHEEGAGFPWHQDDVTEAFKEGYMAGVAQTQHDYAAHYEGQARGSHGT